MSQSVAFKRKRVQKFTSQSRRQVAGQNFSPSSHTGQSFCIPRFSQLGRKLHRQSFLRKACWGHAPFSSLMNQWGLESESDRFAQPDVLGVSTSSTGAGFSPFTSYLCVPENAFPFLFSFVGRSCLLSNHFTLIYYFEMTLIAQARSGNSAFPDSLIGWLLLGVRLHIMIFP